MKHCAPCEVPGCESISLDNLVVAIHGPRQREILFLCPRHDQALKRANARALLAEIRRHDRVPVQDETGERVILQRSEIA